MSRQQELAALGLGPNAHHDAWAAHFAQLAAYHSRHGHCRVPPPPPSTQQPAAPAAGRRQRRQRRSLAELAGSEEAGDQGYASQSLYAWLQQQRQQWRRGTLPDDRRRRLEGLGVEFLAQQASWERRYAELLAFQEVGWVGWRSSRGCCSCC